MDLTVPAASLAALITETAGVADKRASLPILQHLRVSAEADTLTLTGSDLQTWLTRRMPLADLVGPHAGGALCARADKLAAIAKALPSGEDAVHLRATDERLTVRCGRSTWRLATLPGGDYPEPEPLDHALSAELPAADLRAGLQASAYACARDDVRYFLNGVLLEVSADGDARLVATDGHRLAHCPLGRPLPTLAPDGDDAPRQLIVPQTSLAALLRVLEHAETVTLTVTSRALALTAGDAQLYTKLVDGRYPDWRRVIPDVATLPYSARLDSRALLDAAGRVRINSNNKYKGIRLQWDAEQVTLHTEDEAHNSGQDSVDLTHEGAAPEAPVTIGLRADYLADSVRALLAEADSVRIYYSDGDRSVLLEPGDGNAETSATIMPMRL